MWLQRNESFLLLLRELLLDTMSYVGVSDLFKGLVCRIRIVVSARIGRIRRINGVSCDFRAI